MAWLLNNIAKSRLLNFAAATDADDNDNDYNDDQWRWRQHRCRYYYCCRVLLLLLMLPFSSLRHILYAVVSLCIYLLWSLNSSAINTHRLSHFSCGLINIRTTTTRGKHSLHTHTVLTDVLCVWRYSDPKKNWFIFFASFFFLSFFFQNIFYLFKLTPTGRILLRCR